MKTRNICLFLILFCGVVSIHAQEAGFPVDSFVNRISSQLDLFPQEKVYIHTDKPYYSRGETIWFRAYLVDACFHRPVSASKYVYVELKSPLDSTISRLKIKNDNGIYAGSLTLPSEIVEGNYTLYGYTVYMNSMGTDFFYRKNIPIMDSYPTYVQTKTDFKIDSVNNKVTAQIYFYDKTDGKKLEAKDLKYQIDGGEIKATKLKNDTMLHIEAPLQSKLLCIKSGDFQKYISLPTPEETFDVSFFPEGGYLVENTNCCIAYKALNPEGLSENISGQLFDNLGNEILSFKSIYAGMGFFYFRPENDKQYYTICKNPDGTEKRFDLPPARQDIYALKAAWMKNKLIVSVVKSPSIEYADSLSLFMHSRDRLLYASKWNWERDYISFNKVDFPPGISQILLLDKAGNTISKRLVFCLNDTENSTIITDKPSYNTRELVKIGVDISDISNQPLSGNFSVSVTDDSKIQTDSCFNIQTYLLLTSELKGYIESPNFYFQKENRLAPLALDALMLTQGWTRYNIPDAIKGKYEESTGFLEIGQEISGKITTKNKKKPIANAMVSIMSVNSSFADVTQADENGYFRFNGFDYSDSTRYVIKAFTPKGGSRLNVAIDEDDFPEIKNPLVNQSVPSDFVKERKDLDISLGKYSQDEGMISILLDEIVVTSKKKQLPKDIFQTTATKSFTSKDIKEMRPSSLEEILRKVPGVYFKGGEVFLSQQRAAFYVDGIFMEEVIEDGRSIPKKPDSRGTPMQVTDKKDPIKNSAPAKGIIKEANDNPADLIVKPFMHFDYNSIPIQDIERVDVFKSWNSAIFGSRGGGGVIMITTRRGCYEDENTGRHNPKNIRTIMPLGFQKPDEFYSPKYETQEQIDNMQPDLRRTVYWNPNIEVLKEGKASFEFYTTDLPSDYSMIVEGISSNGEIIHSTKKIYVK